MMPKSTQKSTGNMSKQSSPTTQYVEKWKDVLMSGEEMVEGFGTASKCQSIYEALGNSKKVLVTLCIGQKNDNDAPLINLNKMPWCHGPKGIIKPSNKELAMEVQCRRKLILQSDGVAKGNRKQVNMKPKSKFREVLIECLNDWPVADPACVEFVTSEATCIQN